MHSYAFFHKTTSRHQTNTLCHVCQVELRHKAQLSFVLRHTSHVTRHPWGGVVVPPHFSAPKQHLCVPWKYCGAHPFGAVCPPAGPCSRAWRPPAGGRPARPQGLRGGVLAAPRLLRRRPPPRAALRVGAWPCGAGVSVLRVAPWVTWTRLQTRQLTPSATVYGYRGLFGRSAPSDGLRAIGRKKDRPQLACPLITSNPAPYSIVRTWPGKSRKP